MIKAIKSDQQIRINTSQYISGNDLSIISLLYAPLLKEKATHLYISLYSVLNRQNLEAQYSLEDLLQIVGFSYDEFMDAKGRLEALSLIMSYEGEDYLIIVNAPLTARQFLSDGILGMFLYSTIGDKAFKQIQKLFEIPKIDRTKYEEVSLTFDQVFKTKELKDIKGTNNYLVGKKPNKGIVVDNPNFSFELFKEKISTSFLDGHRISKKFENFIKNISYVYMFDEDKMAEIFNQSLNNSGYFDYQLCSKVAQKLFKATNDTDHLPILDTKSESGELEELFRTIDINSLIENSKGEKPTSFELDNVNKLFSEYPYVKREVLNYCIFYSIGMCDGEVPPYTYFKKVLDEWLGFGVSSFDQAKALSEKKENKKNKKKKGNDPEWLEKYRKNFEQEVEDL